MNPLLSQKKTITTRPWRVEYQRVAGWAVLATYSTKERAEQQMKTQLDHYPNANYRVVRKSR